MAWNLDMALVVKLPIKERGPVFVYFDSVWTHCAGKHGPSTGHPVGHELCCLNCGGVYADHGSPGSHLTCKIPTEKYPPEGAHLWHEAPGKCGRLILRANEAGATVEAVYVDSDIPADVEYEYYKKQKALFVRVKRAAKTKRKG